MDSYRIRVSHIMELDDIHRVVGIDEETNRTVVIQIDQRPLEEITASWESEPRRAASTLRADGLNLRLTFEPDVIIDGELRSAA
jgi:hypothetical protein